MINYLNLLAKEKKEEERYPHLKINSDEISIVGNNNKLYLK